MCREHQELCTPSPQWPWCPGKRTGFDYLNGMREGEGRRQKTRLQFRAAHVTRAHHHPRPRKPTFPPQRSALQPAPGQESSALSSTGKSPAGGRSQRPFLGTESWRGKTPGSWPRGLSLALPSCNKGLENMRDGGLVQMGPASASPDQIQSCHGAPRGGV